MANNTIDGSMLDAFLALKENVLKSIHACDVYVVDKINTDDPQVDLVECYMLSQPSIRVQAQSTISVSNGDVVVVVYADHRYLLNYRRKLSSLTLVDNPDRVLPHTMSAPIIIGKLIQHFD